jgi:branched-chain amino acid transport system ATP-binding protein
MTDPDVLLKMDRVEATYSGPIVALHDVSLTVSRGEIIAVLGANGAGKTTTLKAVSNLLPAERGRVTGGTIVFDTVSTPGARPGDLVRRGLVPVLEGRRMFRSLSVEENLITGGIARDSTRAELADDLARIYALFPRLREKRRVLAGLTSGGEQQMTAIGRALMARPRLLVLDEPSMGLAPLVVRIIFRALVRLNREEGLSVLVSEQNSAVALSHAHRAVVLENGVTVLSGTADELRRRDDIKSFYLGGAAPHAA